MINTQQMLCFLLNTVQLDQHLISAAILTASSHTLKSLLSRHLLEYDRMEGEIQEVAGSRGWELPELQPALRWNQGIRFRLSVRSQDDRIAEKLLYLHTAERIDLLRMKKLWELPDQQALLLLQKLLDCNAIQLRQMESHV